MSSRVKRLSRILVYLFHDNVKSTITQLLANLRQKRRVAYLDNVTIVI